MEQEEKVIKSNTEFLAVLGYIFIVIGIIGSISIMLSFDWDNYNFIKDLELTHKEEIEVLNTQRINTIALSGAALLINVAIGSFFIAVDRIALTLKRIQLGVKHEKETTSKDTQ